jgi:dienelactone hydrolase
VRDQGLHFRFDWEAVVSPVVDLALTLPEVDAARLALVGTSLGGYLAARAAAFEHRLAAVVLHDGVYDFHHAVEAIIGAAAAAPGGLESVVAESVAVRWALRNGLWTFGVPDADALVKASEDYTLEGIAGQISCPTLVLDAEADQFFAGQPQRVFDALTCPKTLTTFREDEGGGEHCHEGAIALFHQRTFDWLDTVFTDGHAAVA